MSGDVALSAKQWESLAGWIKKNWDKLKRYQLQDIANISNASHSSCGVDRCPVRKKLDENAIEEAIKLAKVKR